MLNFRRIYRGLTALMLVPATAVVAGDITTGKYAGEFLSIGAGARALAMGGAYVAIARDASSVYWNPAGLSRLDYPQGILMHAQQFAGVVKYNFAAFAVPYGSEASIGIGVIRLGVDDIPFTILPRPDLPIDAEYVDDNGAPRRNRTDVDHYFSDAEYGFFLSFARARSARLAYGASVKVLHKGFENTTAWGIGFDVSVQYNVWKSLLLGVNLQDATTTILAWNTGRKELIIPTLKVGAALPITVGFLGGKLLPAVDADVRFENRDLAAQVAAGPASLDFHAGLEYALRDRLALRAGSDDGHFSAGVGIVLPKLQIDYAFMSHSELKETHRISLQLTIEEAKFRRK